MIVIKVGGGEAIRENLDAILSDIAKIKEPVIIVHGANHEMKTISERLGHPEKIVTSPSGFTSRFTDRETLEIFMMVYAGVANKRIVEKLQLLGINAIGLSGIDGKLLVGKRKPHVKIIEDGKKKILRGNYTGTVETVNSGLILLLLENGYTPVICPPVLSHEGEAVNTDNDRIVGALCKDLPVTEIISLFEAPGLMEDIKDSESLIEEIDKTTLSDYMQYAKGRMKKKILHAQDAVEHGVDIIRFGDGRIDDPVSNVRSGKGTTIR